VIADPRRRGESLAEFALGALGRLWHDVAESAALDPRSPSHRAEWDCFALYACVRGLVAAGGFNRETAAAVDAFHERVLAAWAAEAGDADDPRRAIAARRYAEYGAIGQEGGAAGAASVTRRLGEACARHLRAAGGPAELAGDGLAELVGAVHEILAEGAAEAVRRAS